MRLATITDPDGEDQPDPFDPNEHDLAVFDGWTAEFLDDLAPAHQPVIGTFIRWGLRKRLMQANRNRTMKPWSTRGARLQAAVAVQFLRWLDDRNIALESCSQPDVDAWFADGTGTRTQSVTFLSWAIRHRICRPLRLPNFRPPAPSPMPAAQRLELIARLAEDTAIRLDDRVAGLLVTLYAQPASRITRLRIDDVQLLNGGDTGLCLGDEPVHVVAPLGDLLHQLVASRSDTTWLFPGQQPERPLNPKSLGWRLLRLGVTRAARVAALHELIREIPAPVLAPLIGYNPNFVAERAATLAAPWSAYPTMRSDLTATL